MIVSSMIIDEKRSLIVIESLFLVLIVIHLWIDDLFDALGDSSIELIYNDIIQNYIDELGDEDNECRSIDASELRPSEE